MAFGTKQVLPIPAKGDMIRSEWVFEHYEDCISQLISDYGGVQVREFSSITDIHQWAEQPYE